MLSTFCSRAFFAFVFPTCVAVSQQQKLTIAAEPAANQPHSFAETSGVTRLDSLRKRAALLRGQSVTDGAAQIDSCPGTVGDPPTAPVEDYAKYTNPFGAVLDVAASFGDTGSAGIPSAQTSIQTEALGKIVFESDHFGYNYAKCPSFRPTVSFGGTVGLQPALVLENLSSATASIATPKDRPMFQDAFVWTLGPRIAIATSHMSQLTAFANLGESYLVSQVSSFKQGDDTITAVPVSNNVGQSAVFVESGLEWKYLNTDIANAYLNKVDALEPPFAIAAGFKRDSRFNQEGDIAKLDAARDRVFMRFTVGLNNIGNWTGDQVSPGKGFTFKFGVDYERPMIRAGMPTSTRYYVSANINLVNLFKPSNQ